MYPLFYVIEESGELSYKIKISGWIRTCPFCSVIEVSTISRQAYEQSFVPT
ncbi:hypothetical protein Ana3638_15025 [Anaerocolumna sedimenticola]|uniref:Uncharacterized protein n=1 Tax=Anaerocolumna sedimenticola TaxID=2696063 RepID=A0A6P1TLM2_9FIRM|nr:hypothetical protein [Anaerocolumna sedimenticola]QHQ61934.1 hypothetical protein Ana3638_15025 [Anaerocolumna sedimenticola]